MKNAMQDLHSKILRKFHTLCSCLNMTPDEKATLVASYGVESSADIDTIELVKVCNKLSEQLGQTTPHSMDCARKQAMAAIGGYLRMIGYESNAEIIKSIACRSTGYDNFNRIPSARLRNIYYAFLNKQKDIESADTISDAVLAAQMFRQQYKA